MTPQLDLEGVRIFVKVAALASFTRAAEHLGMTKTRTSSGVRNLEAALGIRLLQRTTRTVRLTADGEQFLPRAKRLIEEAEDIATMFQGSRTLRGTVRIDLPTAIASHTVIPRLPEFLHAHPLLDLQLSSTDRRVDLVREGFDCVLSIGSLADSGLISQRLGAMPMVNCASADYVRKRGLPRDLDDLDNHVLVHYTLKLGTDPPTFEYPQAGTYAQRPMRSSITVNNTEAYRAACVAGLGIIQVPRRGSIVRGLEDGTLVEVLPQLTCEPMPVTLVHGHGRTVPKRVRAVMTWVAGLIKPGLI